MRVFVNSHQHQAVKLLRVVGSFQRVGISNNYHLKGNSPKGGELSGTGMLPWGGAYMILNKQATCRMPVSISQFLTVGIPPV